VIDRTPKPCHHKIANHQHGNYQTYVSDRCRCLPCAFAYSEYNSWQNDRKAAGKVNHVPDRRAREHVAALRNAGWRVNFIVAETGVSKWTIQHLLTGKPRMIQVATERRILALDIDTQADRSILVDATGTRRRVQALIALGWPVQTIQKMAGLGDHALFIITGGQAQCFTTTRDTIRDLYDKLWNTPPPPSPAAVKAKKRAEQRGYAPPLAWDDDNIDDPNATPNTGDAQRDAESREAERLALWKRGMTDRQIAAATGRHHDAIRRWRLRNGLPSQERRAS